MDRNRKKHKKQQGKKKQAGSGETAQPSFEQRMMEEEERLVRLTMELSLKESLNAPPSTDDVADIPTALLEKKFEAECRAALFDFDPRLQDLIDPSIDDTSSNTSAASLPHQYLQQHNATGAREKQFKEKLNLALLFASILGYARVVKYLIDRGASLHSKPLNGWTPMHWAAAQGQVAVLRVMLASLPSTNLLHDFKDKTEMTPLDVLAQELEQTPVKIPLELLKLFGRWRSAISNPASTSTPTNTFYMQDLHEEGDDDSQEDLLLNEPDEEDEEEEEEHFVDSERSPSRLFAWGTGNLLLQGHGDMSSRANPKRVASLEREDIVSLTTSQFSSGAVTSDGKVFVWGIGEAMRLGMPMSNHSQEPTPKQIPEVLLGDQPAVSITMSNYHGAILLADGSVFTFGRGREGQLGLGQSLCDASSLIDPNLPPTLSYLKQGILSNSGNATTTSSSREEHGSGSPSGNSSSPFGAAVATSASSDNQAAVLKPSGGDPMGHFISRVKLPRTRIGDSSLMVTQIACSDSHTALLMADGQCWTFGNGSKGQLGHDLLRGEHSPRMVRGLPEIRFKHLSVGPTHTVLASNSDIWVFGFGNANPRRQKFAFGTPAKAVMAGLLPSFTISALASGSLHYLILTKEGDLFSWMHGIDKFPVPVNIDIRQLERQRQQFEASMAHSGFSVASGSSTSSNLSLSGNASLDQRSGLDRERHHIVKIACVGVTNYVTTSDGLIFTFSNSNRRGTPFQRLNIQPRLRLFAPGRSHFLATIDQPIAPRESWRPPVPPRLLVQHLESVYINGSYTDVLLECQGEIRRGHKFLLSISPFLDSLFTSSTSEISEVRLKDDTSLVALDLMLSFIYYGQFVIPEHYKSIDRKKILSIKASDKDSLLTLATEWGINELVTLVETGKSAVSEHVRIVMDEELGIDIPANGSPRSFSVKSYLPWIRKVQSHLATQVANPKYSDGVLLVEQEHSDKSSKTQQNQQVQSKADEIPIHKALLIERSEWFRMTLSMSSNWTESRSAQVAMPHLRSESARLVLSYLYTDSLPNKQETSLANLQQLTDLAATSDELLMPELKLIVARRLSRTLTPENVAAILDVAETYQSQQLYECILKFVASNVELFLRLGSLFELTNHQMALVQQIVHDDRGIQPWRYFKQEIEDKLVKLSTTLHGPSTEQIISDSSAPVTSAITNDPGSDTTEGQEISTKPAASKSMYIPPAKRRAMEEAEQTSSSPSKPSFADIQREQADVEAKAAAAKKPAVPSRGIFAWGPPAATTATPASTVNRTLLATDSTSSWPSLPAGKPLEPQAPAPVDSTSSSSTATTATTAPAPTAPKKQKVLPSPLRDPKSLSPLKDAVYNPKSASVPAPGGESKLSITTTTTNGISARTTPPVRPAETKSAAPVPAPAPAKGKAKMSAAAAEYTPSYTVSAPSGAKKTDIPAPSAGGNPKGGKNNRQPRQNQNKKNELAGGMKPTSKSQGNRNNQQGQGQRNGHENGPRKGFNAQEEAQIFADDLALALALSAQDKDILAIQQEEMAIQQHRQRSILEIQEEERQIEEHKMVEAYYASQKLKDEQAKATSSSVAATSSKNGHGGNRQGRRR